MIPQYLAVFSLGVSIACAEMRDWRSADGSKTFRGEFVKQSGITVTIRYESGKELAFPTEKLHADDIQWLKDQSAKSAADTGVFGGIRFGDNERQLAERLKTNLYVIAPDGGKKSELGSPDTLLDTKTRLKPGGSPATLSFLWATKDNVNKLTAFDITCAPQTAKDYDGRLRKSLDELTELLISIHGKPGVTAPYPARESLKKDDIFSTGSWTLADNSTLEVGVGVIEQDQYLAVARYNEPPVVTPKPSR